MEKNRPRFGRLILPPLLQKRRPMSGQDQRPLTPAGHVDEELPVRQVAGKLQQLFTIL